MIPVLLTKIKTSDGVVLEGIAVLPKKKSDTALIWLHGLSSRFSSGQALIQELSSTCRKNGIGYFKFNTRGHDIAARNGEKIIGAGFEKFEECVFDIRAMIRFARFLGFKKIILAGHSTGTNKILYYLYKTQDRAVKGLALLGPISDISVGIKFFGKEKIEKDIQLAKNLQRKKGALMIRKDGVWSPQRFLSLNQAGSKEDVFPYHHPHAEWKELKSIHVPLAVIIGSRDEYLDRPAKNLIELFRKHATSTKLFTGGIIPKANHGFRKKEKELTQKLIEWIKSTK